jgi:hypothetical protein
MFSALDAQIASEESDPAFLGNQRQQWRGACLAILEAVLEKEYRVIIEDGSLDAEVAAHFTSEGYLVERVQSGDDWFIAIDWSTVEDDCFYF